MNTSNALKKLDGRIGRGWRLGLDGMRRTLAKLPPVEYPVILVGGTNGKGSVSASIFAILRAHGLVTGLTTSPHLCEVRERIVVDDRMISVQEFEDVYAEIDGLDDDDATYFEMIALMAIRYFQLRRVDAAVVEIGMGGRLDAFNALDPAVSVITSIGLEHTEYLGGTLEKIAAEKAQIARPRRPIVLGSVLPCLKQEVEGLGARCVLVPPHENELFHDHNRRVALAASGSFLGEGAVAIAEPWSPSRAAATVGEWPCRFEYLPGSPDVLLDAAHNPSGAVALAARLRKEFPGRRIVGLCAFLSDKDDAGFFRPFGDGLVTNWIVSEVAADRARRARDVACPENSVIEANLAAAFGVAKAHVGADGILLITGSIYLLGEILRSGLVESAIWKRLYS